MDDELFGADYWKYVDSWKIEAGKSITHAQAIADSYPSVRPWCRECGSYDCEH